ncbi:tripartite tricarboxylate transporter substrate binding protein [Streptomyces roseirectus]|uniref:Tripartite tricarboxylate transporter substrate binding protein n=1 Tax=Streptomyces roseirectus TaxID=2768066 RepID=A0A7H0IRL4_9ACTN|nr:tripartite tricarboxylate transporter substrate binding protein [Streptomyces roseirectus]QNP75430.1 tripartite tricarboxylate transporter substrate binding protein [Streptomyces roseirectus]
MRNRLRLALPALLLAGACADGSRDGLRIMVPNTPGGGYDTTARVMARVMDRAGIAADVQVFNLPGAGGTVGLRRTVNEHGNGRLALQMGLGVVGASHLTRPEATVADTTPLARLMAEASAVVVPGASPYRSVGDLVDAWRADPDRVTVGGGSSPGGPDHLLPMRLAKTVGIVPRRVRYVAYDGGGGELLPALLDGKVTFATSGFGEFVDQIDAGQLRVLAVTGSAPVPALPGVPTLTSAGIDLEFTNWRGVVAPPGISTADRERWTKALTALHETPQWRTELARRGWTDAFLTGDAFGEFLEEQDAFVAGLVTQLDLARPQRPKPPLLPQARHTPGTRAP